MKELLLPKRNIGVPLLMFFITNYVLIICYHLFEHPDKYILEALMILPYIGGVFTIVYPLMYLPKLLNGDMTFFAIDEISTRE